MIQNHHHHLWAKLIENGLRQSGELFGHLNQNRAKSTEQQKWDIIYFLFYIKTFLRKLWMPNYPKRSAKTRCCLS